VPLNIVCFRFILPRLDEAQLNQINRELMMELHERGIAVPTSTFLQGKYVLRVAITNHRSRREDFEALVRESSRIGKELLRRM
jgi:glutamate/tyrosine decarboxylase-like PLP-dependent enzyme